MPKRNSGLRARAWRGLALAACAAALGGAPPAAAATPTIAPEELHAGQIGEVRTVLAGTEPVALAVEILGLMPDGIAPGVPLVLCRLADETGRFTGVAAGMSGSPVYVDGKLAGALAYSIGVLPREPICGITPIGAMRALEALPGGPPPEPEGLGPAPLAIAVGGLGADVARRFADLWEKLGMGEGRVRLLPAAGTAGGTAPGSGGRLEPGDAVSALLVWGDARIAATGTVTWREGDELLAFGHPFLGFGRVDLALAPAEIVHTVASQLNAFKIARIGDPVGTVTQDRLTAIGGTVGPIPPSVSFDAVVERPGRALLRRHYEIVRQPLLTPILADMLLRQSASATQSDERDEALVMRATLTLADGARLSFRAAGSGSNGAPEQRLGQELQRALAALMQAPVALPGLASVEVEIGAAEPGGGWTIAEAVPDRLAARPGETIGVRALLRGPRGARRQVTLPVEVPAQAAPGSYTLLVGSARAVEGQLGSLAEARLKTATDAADYLDALRERRSDASLAAVLARRGEGIVRGGEVYPALPASVHNLVRARPGGESMFRARYFPVARAELDLDRSVAGGVQTVIEILSVETRR